MWTPALFVENVFWLGSKRAEVLLKLSRDWSAPSETWQRFISKHLHCWNTSLNFFVSLESFPFCSAPTWTDLHGCFSIGTIICTVLCGLMRNDWGGQVYLSFAVRFTFFLSSPLSVGSFILGSLLYFSDYLRDNFCNRDLQGRAIDTSCQTNAARILLTKILKKTEYLCIFLPYLLLSVEFTS